MHRFCFEKKSFQLQTLPIVMLNSICIMKKKMQNTTGKIQPAKYNQQTEIVCKILSFHIADIKRLRSVLACNSSPSMKPFTKNLSKQQKKKTNFDLNVKTMNHGQFKKRLLIIWRKTFQFLTFMNATKWILLPPFLIGQKNAKWFYS